MKLPSEVLAETATLMENYSVLDESARVEMARHLSGTVVLRNTVMPTLEALRQERLAGEDNFKVINDLVELLPQAERTEGFFVDDEYTYRFVQANAIDSQQQDGNFYIIGARPLNIEKKAKLSFTELLLWPANKGHVLEGLNYNTRESYTEPVCPQITAVVTEHYETYRNVSEQIVSRPLIGTELEEALDAPSGKLVLGALDYSGILDWYRKNTLTHPHGETERIETVMMATPKKRWGYEPRTFDGAITSNDIVRFGVLNNLTRLIGEYGRGKEAAAYLLGITAAREEIE